LNRFQRAFLYLGISIPMPMSSRILPISVFSFLLFTFCTPKSTEQLPKQKTLTESEAPLETGVMEEQGRETISMLISFRKSSCYGNCPAYEARFYSDGTVLYHGIRNVKYQGYFKSIGHQTMIHSILKNAEAIRFFDLADFYPIDAPAIPDLPSTFTYINYKGKEKKIQNNYDGPNTLFELQKQIADQLTTIKWQADSQWDD